MTPVSANDNNKQPRPQWFDDLLMQYDPFIRRKCAGDEDLYQDTRLRALERWPSYRHDGSFASWSGYLVRGVKQDRARKAVRHAAKEHLAGVTTTLQPSQEHYTDINLVLESLTTVESVSLRCAAMGFEYQEIGKMRRVSKQAIGQAVKSGRVRLAAANDNVKQDKKAAA